MWHFLRRMVQFFLAGFILTFLIYLFAKFGADDVFLGILIGLGGGVAVTVAVAFLERRFPEQTPGGGP